MIQKWLFWLFALGAGALAVANPDAVYKLGEAGRRLTAGSVVQVATLGKGQVK